MSERLLREEIFLLREEVRQLRCQLAAPNGPYNFRDLELTRSERSILTSLLLKVHTKQGLIDRLNADRGRFGEQEPKIMDVMICRLRAKLRMIGGLDWLKNSRGIGYYLSDEGRRELESRLV